MRYTIKNFDREHPEQALFPEVTGPLDEAAKKLIFNSFRRGIAVDTLAKRFQRTRTSMYRVINEVRAERLLEQPLDYISHTSFDDPIDGGRDHGPDAGYRGVRGRAPQDARPQGRAAGTGVALRDAAAEPRAGSAPVPQDELPEAQGQPSCGKMLDPCRARTRRRSTRSRRTQNEAQTVKDMLINCNMRLVVSIAKRHAGQTNNFFELLSDGNMSLIRAVEKFDYSRGNKFSTYASWAIMKNFARTIPEEKHRRDRYVTGHEEMFEAAPDNRTDEHEVRGIGRAGDAQGQSPAGVPRSARTRDHPHAGRPGQRRRRHDAGEDRPAARHHQGARPPAQRAGDEEAPYAGGRPEARSRLVTESPKQESPRGPNPRAFFI